MFCQISNYNFTLYQVILEETQEMIDAMDGISTVHGRYYQLSSDYHRIGGQHALYYRDALRYLGCTELDDIDGM